jgi:beta-mannanase
MSRLRFVVPIVALVLPLAFLFASGPIEAKPTALSTTAFAYPPAVANNCLPSVYYGVYVPGWLDNLDALTTFENDAKKKVSIVMWYQGWGLTDGTQDFQTSWMNNVRSHGSIPMVTWEPWLYTDPAGTNQPQYQLSKIINGDFDSYIKRWADDSMSWGHPYFLRFAAEMNGNWFPWSEQVNENKPGEYVRAWRHVYTIFANKGVTNVTWVWSPNIEYDGSTPLEELYPGDDYVDWLGMDGYNWGTVPHRARTASLEGISTNRSATVTNWQTFSEIFSQTYTHITALSTKPLMVAETASAEQGGSKANWITDAYSTQIPGNFEKIKAIIWFNENKERDWRIESSPAAQNAFATAIQPCFYATNQYASLCISPILIPSLIGGGKCHIYLPLVLK